MTALSFWQPYAWLIVNGHADVDSRTWAPPAKRLGTRIAVHASKRKLTRAEFKYFLEMMNDLKIKKHPRDIADFDYGKVVGTVIISEVKKNSKSYWAVSGYFHWLLKNPKKMRPIAVKGKMGWFPVTFI